MVDREPASLLDVRRVAFRVGSRRVRVAFLRDPDAAVRGPTRPRRSDGAHRTARLIARDLGDLAVGVAARARLRREQLPGRMPIAADLRAIEEACAVAREALTRFRAMLRSPPADPEQSARGEEAGEA